MTPIQKEIYLSHLENEKEMRHKKPSDASIQALWTKMCSKLNAVKGPMKEIEEWKKVNFFICRILETFVKFFI